MSISPFDLLKMTFHSLGSKPLRSTLTTLGVFMGVTAVNATLQVGNISRAVIAQQLAEREAPQVIVVPRWAPNPQQRIELEMEDVEFLRQRLIGLQAISGTAWVGFNETLFQDRAANPSTTAVSQDHLLTSGSPLVEGRFFTPTDFANYRPVVVIDQFLAAQLFEGQRPVGQRIYSDRQPYTVVGVVPTRLSEDRPPEGQVIMPMSFYTALTGSHKIGRIRLRPRRMEDLESLASQAKKLLMQRFPGRTFRTWSNVDDLLEQQKTLELMSRGLAIVGIISLLVGGVGIANIMIASVTERTAEIGLRRSIGATQQEIMLQFILEIALLSLLGGMAAIASVHGLTLAIANAFKLPYQFEVSTASFALGAALLVGVGAGFLPALRASQLDPVKALRSE